MNIIISNSSQEPIYEQIVKQIKNMIINGELEAGFMLPSMRNLAKELQISVITTKRAYEELEREGFIQTVGGKGSFVSGENKEFIREKRIKALEDKLAEAITESIELKIAKEELLEMIDIIYEEA